ncbi:hypothetical protein D3Z62_32185, partial [Lachnospiraceae bacterium]|nr:hypothetical protein [Lachnospiraceae bacterium]
GLVFVFYNGHNLTSLSYIITYDKENANRNKAYFFKNMPCKKMSKDVSIPTFTIQYLMESGQGLTSNVGNTIVPNRFAMACQRYRFMLHCL